jgi:hypothetical protein
MKYKIWWPFSLFTSSDEKLGLYRKFGKTNIAVDLPAIVGAKMCVEGEAARGVIPAECLGPIKFLNWNSCPIVLPKSIMLHYIDFADKHQMMADIGWPMKFHETLAKEVSIS